MADLKPLGSEKLAGDDKLKRILELTYYKNSNNKTQKDNTEFISESKTGGIYGIVKEKDGYFVKRGLNESSLDYIGGMFMKNKNKFSSYAEALKRLNLLKGQEELQEATKYVLKTKTPQEEAPVAEPSMDMPPMAPEEPMPELPSPSPEENMDAPAASDEPSMDSEMGSSSEEGKRSDYMAEVQKFAGKLGQELRDQKDKMESDDIKYVLNMIISAVDLDQLEEDDIEEIGKKFDREEEDMPVDGPEMEDEEMPAVEPEAEEDLNEMDDMDPMDALESFVNAPAIDVVDDMEEIDLSSYSHNETDVSAFADIDEMNDEVELDLDEIKHSINTAIGETLSKYFK
jgi:hypothetical protein